MTRSRFLSSAGAACALLVFCVLAAGEVGSGCREGDPTALVVGQVRLRVSEVAPIMDRALKAETLYAMPAGLDEDGRRAWLKTRAAMVMDALVDEQLVLAEAARLGLEVDEADIAGRIEGLQAGFPEMYQTVVAKVGVEGYASKLRMHLLYEGAKANIISAGRDDCRAGERPSDDQLLERWLRRARAATPIRVLYDPPLGSYLEGVAAAGEGP